MISLQVWGLLLTFAVPMIVSPGPGNTILAAAGGKFGIRGTIPFWFGFEAGNLVWCLIYGFGLSKIFVQHPQAYELLKWGGTVYVLYLAYGFFVSSSQPGQDDLKPLGFHDGFLSLSLNPKVHSMILVMFSQFLNPAQPLTTQVLEMTAVFVIMGFGLHFLWIYGGQVMFSRIKTEKAMRLQGYVFGIAMIAVSILVATS